MLCFSSYLASQAPPTFDLDWRSLAVVLEAGSEGVDADAVKAAVVASAPGEIEGRIVR